MTLEFTNKCYNSISLITLCSAFQLILVKVTGGITGTDMKLLIYEENDQICIHDMKTYKNAVFNDDFMEISIPIFKGMKDTYCTNFCIRTGLCNAIIVAQSTEGRYKDGENEYLPEFDWCATFKIQKKNINVIDLVSSQPALVVEIWNDGITPNKSELIVINFNACCPNQCPEECDCQNTEDGLFICTSPLSNFEWFGPEAKVHLPFEEDTCWTDIVGNVQFVDGMANKALLLDGQTSLEINLMDNGGCWKDVSSCKSFGFGVAFWIKILSQLGFENNSTWVGVISTLRSWTTGGWNVHLTKWESSNYLKIQINDGQLGKQVFKNLEGEQLLFNQWLHYAVSYKYKVQNDDPNVLFKVYKNGQLHNNGWAHYENYAVSKDIVNKLVFGRLFSEINTGPYANVLLDDLLIIDGTFDDELASKIYQSS